MWEKALESATRVTHPASVAAFALVFAAFILTLALRTKKTRLAWLLTSAIIILGLAPLIASTFLQSRGMYRVRVVVLGIDQSPVDDASVKSSTGGEAKKVDGGWEFDIPPQTKPANGKVTLHAKVSSAFLTGNTTLVLGEDYFPTATIQLSTDTSAMLRGVVLDLHRKSVSGAQVSIPGYASVVTDEMGNFALPAHTAEGQVVEVRAQKDQLSGSMSVPAGKTPVEIVISRH
jgi:hypothetical protein